MKRVLAACVALAVFAPAQGVFAEDDEEEDDDFEDDEEEDDEDSKANARSASDEEEDEGDEAEDDEADDVEDDDGLPPKQNLTGHDLAGKRPTEFERDRFFVDKVDTEATEKGTLVQGSIASSSFFYGERGGDYPNLDVGGNTGPRRLFTELRLQTDFRHISGGRWDARIDTRARVVSDPADATFVDGMGGMQTTEPNRIQSGLFGANEYDVRELWLIRSGKRSDVFIGRQFVPDLGGVKLDGLRVDYAKSAKLTLVSFGGLMPVRGSRSVTTDYLPLQVIDPATGMAKPAGRFVGTGGFGAAYRTLSSYGALGAVAQVPLKVAAEKPRFYVTGNGYLRNGAKLDVFHYVLVDLYGNAAEESTGRIQLTNVSAGMNYKPSSRLRLTAALHRVDTETLAVHAGAFLQQPDQAGGVGPTIVQNEAYIQRIATDTVRGGVSAGLGKQQRFEISTALSFRRRPDFTLTSPDRTTQIDLPKAQSVEVWGSVVDRRSIKNTRIGIEASRTFAVGQLAFQRSIALITRAYVLREIAGGRGEWEAEASFSDIRDTVLGMGLGCAMVSDCYGTSNNKLYSVGGQLFYRIRKDWFGIGTLHLLRITNVRSDKLVDPAVTGLTGFVRIAKRF